jgi:hypothetical protein
MGAFFGEVTTGDGLLFYFYSADCEVRRHGGSSSFLPFISGVTLGKFVLLSAFYFPHLKKWRKSK